MKLRPFPIIICAGCLLYSLPTDIAVAVLIVGGVLAGVLSAAGGGRH